MDRFLRSGMPAPDAKVLGPDGPLALSSLWTERPLLLVFLRHYGWPFCRQHAVQLRGLADRIEAAGAGIASVTIGDPSRADAFCERFARNRYPCLGDPELAAYHAYGLPRGSWLDVAGPRVWGAGATAIRHGVASRPGDDVLRLGGTFGIRTDGTLAYAHYAHTSSDNADPMEAVAALAPG